MSANDALLIFVDAYGAIARWLQLRDGAVAARGAGRDELPPLAEAGKDPLRIVAIVPGDSVSLHWLEIPEGLAPAQAVAAARLMASEISAQPLADMHAAVGGPIDDGNVRVVALAPMHAMAAWIGDLQAHGLDPDIVIPETLLIAPPADGFARYDAAAVPLYRGVTGAFALEAELADLIVAGQPVTTLDTKAFEAGLGGALAALPVNLRQGPFAKRRRWKIEWPLLRRLAWLALAILAVTLAIQIASILRYTFAADALEGEAAAVARQAVPGAGGSAQLEERLVALRGSGVGYSAIAATVFGAVRDTANAELTAILYDRDGSLRVTVQGDGPATIAALRSRIEASGLSVSAGPLRSGGGRQIAELTVRAP